MSGILLREDLSPTEANLVESITSGGKDFFLSGIMMQGEIANGNKRVYQTEELSKIVEHSMQKISQGHLILGELQHPDNITINLQNVSHAITEMRMDGNNVVGKMKMLNTPSGNIARAIMEGGVRLGVSSRGTGNVDSTGKVSGFQFVTVDIVSTPSAPDAFPDLVREALETQKIVTLAEAVTVDNAAQIFFEAEIKKFLRSLLG